ncbi:hypothetical protein WICANDRAFT_92049 [Wickerhamomyces anomalus NRRL Y-366-8]|uniref:Uncharacterized protein n=1 Tax=Wickerhamomyces anomalus (strain ATCC 58044 / CBS 1984 / NCYC 433 / NRRL Y-366-8) TaxID=683960 RepID=A0A1E3P437_WICAA|nr:uncharacterized protein WICANDRAFT_92049 [Wickerhamomyces anomalus NRRL Y-366-8]ODQ59964.1 hypothetical protein WICANDRAFT_92049 [Wickerhamomyces anomalus NRRL Y-366-8]
MSFFGNDLAAPQSQQLNVVPEAAPLPSQVPESSNELNQQASLSEESSSSSKRQIESHPFVNQFSEVEKAISNFTKHQPFNHHYAPNVHPNRGHNNHYNNNRYNNNNNNNNNNGRFHHHNQQQQLPIVQRQQQQAPQQQIPNQQQQFFNGNNNAGLQNRFQKLPSSASQPQQQQQPLMQQQYQLQQQQLQQLQQQQQQIQLQQQQLQQQQQIQQTVVQPQQQQQFLNNDLKFDIFQQPQDLSLPLRKTASPTFNGVPMRPNSVNSFAPLEQINTGSSFGLGGSDLISTPVSNPIINGGNVDKNISLDDSTTNAYLGDLWGNSKNLRSSTSVWA